MGYGGGAGPLTVIFALMIYGSFLLLKALFYLMLCTIWVLIQLFKAGRAVYRHYKRKRAAKNDGGGDFPKTGEPPTVVMSPVR